MLYKKKYFDKQNSCSKILQIMKKINTIGEV